MKNLILVFLFSLSLSFVSCSKSDAADEKITIKDIETDANKLAMNYLNNVRANPKSFSKELGVDLSNVKSKPALEWNDKLALAAYNKAKDMAERGFFGHVDPDGFGMNRKIAEAGFKLEDYLNNRKDQNNFESIACGTNRSDATIMVKELIIDKGIPSLGHRKHLLGMTDFFGDCKFCGIGFYKKPGSYYTYYCCVLVAKHK